MSVELEFLVNKLDSVCKKALQKGAETCVSRTHFYVEPEHFLLHIVDMPDTDFQLIAKHYHVDTEKTLQQISQALETEKRGNHRTPSISEKIVMLLQEAWNLSSVYWDRQIISTGAVIVGLMKNQTTRKAIVQSIPEFAKFTLKDLESNAKALSEHSKEINHKEVQDKPSPGNLRTPNLDQYTIDITHRVKIGLIDPVAGRETEIRQIIDILMRRRQNNPILTGDAGVGKTSVVEGFAWKVIQKKVPVELQHVSVRTLDLGLLQAGAGVKGEFEQRLKSVIKEVKQSPHPVILFVDEAHNLIGAGGESGQGDAANLLKPVLARGELRTIAATTWSEYKKYFEKDPALTRRFQLVKIAEPEPDAAMNMLRVVERNLSRHHKVRILDEAIVDAVKLSHRYMSGRRLPDKAISLLDTACARVAIGQHAPPPEIEDLGERREQIAKEIEILSQERFGSDTHALKIQELTASLFECEENQQNLIAQWETEKSLIEKIVELETKPADMDESEFRQLVQACEKELSEAQGTTPMVHLDVDADIVASVVADWTGIPVGKMVTDEIKAILNLQSKMSERLIGQTHALKTICDSIKTSRANLEDPRKPLGVFLLVGPSGVGKTETAVTLADLLYGGEHNLISINMSEYQEAHTVSSLKGAPPGYVGYGSGGVLTEAVRRKPFSVVLLDEVEKAHPDVLELFFQVFDKGIMEDGEGVVVDFKNTLIILTSNVATHLITAICREQTETPACDHVMEQIRPELLNNFKPAFLGRLVTIPYYALTDTELKQIVRLKMDKIKQRFEENHHSTMSYTDQVVDLITSRCTEVESGARNIDHILSGSVLPEMSDQLLNQMAAEQTFTALTIDLDENDAFTYRFDQHNEI